MKDELALSATGFGIAVSAFFWIYAPMCVARRLAVRPRLRLPDVRRRTCALWALSTTLTGFVNGLTMLIVLRLTLGLGESIAFPGAGKIIAAAGRARKSGQRQFRDRRRNRLRPGGRGARRWHDHGRLWLAPDLPRFRPRHLAVAGAVAFRLAPARARRGSRRRSSPHIRCAACSACRPCGSWESVIPCRTTASISCLPGCRCGWSRRAAIRSRK